MSTVYDRPTDRAPRGSKCVATCKRPARSQAHCTVCHLTFGGVHGFAAHRRGGWCLDPATIGYVEREQVWRQPMDDALRTRFQPTPLGRRATNVARW